MNAKRIAIAAAVILSAIGVTAAIIAATRNRSSASNSSNYSAMMGGTTAPQWRTGGPIPAMMMGSAQDLGNAMGSALADVPGPKVSAADATQLGTQVPAGAVIDRSARRITIRNTVADANLTVLASPRGGPDEAFRIAGMVNPTVVIPQGSRLRIELVNADSDTAHGLVVTRVGASRTWMPMTIAAPAFAGSAAWVLGNATAAGMHTQTLAFTATTRGTYQYLCPVAGHAQQGMVGALIVKRNRQPLLIFQIYETTIFLSATLIVVGPCDWRVKHHLT